MAETKDIITELTERITKLEALKETETPKVNKTKASMLKAANSYYQRMKSNLDFRLKIRDRNRLACERKKKIKPKITIETTPIETPQTEAPKITIEKLNKPIVLCFNDEEDSLDLGF